MVTGKYNNGIVFTSAILLILLAMIVTGCSGTEMIPVSPGPSDATATSLPGPANGSVNDTVQAGTTVNNSTRPWIGYDAAADSVRLFLDNPAANVNVSCLGYYYFHPAYSLESDGDSFLVNAYTGEVEYANFTSRPAGTFRLIVEDACIASRDFARKHYSDFDRLPGLKFVGCQLHEDIDGFYYESEWRQTIDGSDTLNFVVVSLSAFDGKVCGYQSMHVSPDVPASTPVAKREAVRAAVDYVVKLTYDTNVTAYDDSSECFTDWWFNATAQVISEAGPININLTIKPAIADLTLIVGDGRVRQVVWSNDQLQAYQPNPYDGSGSMVSFGHWGKVYVDTCTGRVVKFIPCR
jgi:hypothetical protein